MILSIIVAYQESQGGGLVIGKDNGIPWHLPHDLLRFKDYTMGHPIIMGRKTHESIGRVLKGRDNIIVTGQINYEVPGAYVFNNLDKALHFAAVRASEGFVIGGEEIYHQTLDKVDRLYITHVKGQTFDGDAFFPKWPKDLFKPIHREMEGRRVEFEILERDPNKRNKVEKVPDSAYDLLTGSGI